MSENVLDFIFAPQFPFWLEIVRIVFIAASFLLLVATVILLFKTSWIESRFLKDWEEFFTFKPSGARPIAKRWDKIKKRLESGIESEYKLAVIEADSLLEEILEKGGFKGEHFEERLKQLVPMILSDIEPILGAHKTRSNIIHDPDYKFSLNEVQEVLAVYEKTLQDLGVF